MLSAWDVYWVMQLDSIGAAFFWVPAVLLGIWLFLLFASEGEVAWNKEGKRLYGYVKPFLAVTIGALFLCPFIPSTKTAAAMIVVPAIANNETLHREAGELYGLAKSALKEAVSGDEAAKE